ncbi:MAG: EAL domain-containing protein [Butyrivibrio sp.]|nr:EAL domain-containing protein [Butyrivibrio sp.]
MKKKTIRKSILLNNLIIISITLIFFGCMTIFIMYQKMQSDIVEKNAMITMALGDQLATVESDPQKIAKYISNLYDVDTNSKIMFDNLSNIKKENNFILNVEIIDAKGQVVLSQLDADDIGINRSGEEFYKKLCSAATGSYWSEPFQSTAIGGLAYAYTYKSPKNYYVTIYSSLKALSEISKYYGEKFGDYIQVDIVDEYGRYVSHENLDYVHFRMVDQNINAIKEVAQGYLRYKIIDIGSVKYVMTATSMHNSRWYIVIYQPFSVVFGPLRKLILILTALIGFAALIGTIDSYIYSGQINHYVLKLKDFVEKAAVNAYKAEVPDFKFVGLNNVAHEFSELMNVVHQRDEQLTFMAYNDPLTNLGNRLLISKDIMEKIADENDDQLTIVLLNIDAFKIINDLYGHQIADKILIYIGHEIKEFNEIYACSAYRIGPDEFAVLFRQTLELDEIMTLLKPLKDALIHGIFIDDKNIRISMTSGVSVYDAFAMDKSELLSYADMALIDAKTKSRGSICLFNQEMKVKMKYDSGMDQFLRTALEENMFELFFQPQINIAEQKIEGFESLIRLRKRSGEYIPPNQFIKIAENTGLIIEIGEWVLREAISRLQQINETFGSEYKMAINISTIQMNHPEFAASAIGIVSNSNAPLERLEFEITESVFINEGSDAFHSLQKLHDFGINFALDDFGTGYSSLSYLTSMPFQTLKIDRSFIADVETKEVKKSMLEAIISMGHKLHYKLVAEGIENEEQKKICSEYNCDIIQGYYYSKPLPFEDLINYIRSTDIKY